MTDEEIEDLLPLPFKIELTVDQDDFQNQLGHSLREARLAFNKKNNTDIQVITISFPSYDFSSYEEDDGEENTYKIFIGKRKIMEGVINPLELRSLIPIVEYVMQNFYHDIQLQQEENESVCDKLDALGKYGILFNFYKNIGNNKLGFHYLKKAAAQDDRYKRGLLRAYNGTGAVVHKDYEMAAKLQMRYRNKF